MTDSHIPVTANSQLSKSASAHCSPHRVSVSRCPTTAERCAAFTSQSPLKPKICPPHRIRASCHPTTAEHCAAFVSQSLRSVNLRYSTWQTRNQENSAVAVASVGQTNATPTDLRVLRFVVSETKAQNKDGRLSSLDQGVLWSTPRWSEPRRDNKELLRVFQCTYRVISVSM